MEQLEQKIRRSSKLKDRGTFRELLAYASMVRDQDEVYSYMEENKIGLHEPEFWTAKLTMLKNRCQYREFVKVLKAIAKNHQLQSHPKYWLINQTVNELQKYLQRLLRQKAKGKRSAKQYQVLNFTDVEKQTRKFGKIQVYVDPDCRIQYRLENLAQFVTRRLPEQCQTGRNFYQRQISSKPLSFIGKEKDKINQISREIFDLTKESNGRLNPAPKKSGRISLVCRKSNKGCLQLVETPDFKKKSFSKESHKKKQKNQHFKDIESLQVFSCQRKSKVHSRRKQKGDLNPEFEITSSISSVKKQKMRHSPDKETESIFSSEKEIKQSFAFSFADECININESKRSASMSSGRGRESTSKGQRKVIYESLNDLAFMEDTNKSSNNMERSKDNEKNTLEFENAIKQIQMQRYDSQTFSEIDSNKENNLLLGEDSWTVNINFPENVRDQATDRGRKKFETIKKGTDVYQKKLEGEKNSNECRGWREEMNQSSQLIYQQLLSCLDGESGFQRTAQIENQLSMSERRRKKRISRISEERSYSFSQTRPRSKSNT